MTRTRARIAATLGTAAVAAGLAGPAGGAAVAGRFPFYDCTGPAGTPSSFTAFKEDLPAAEGGTSSAAVAYRIDDGSGVFVVLQFGDTRIGKGIPGARITTSCLIDFRSGTFTFSGFIAPAGA